MMFEPEVVGGRERMLVEYLLLCIWCALAHVN